MLTAEARFNGEFAILELEERRASDALYQFQPHTKQQAFIDAVLGSLWYENWLIGSNRLGKSDAGVFCDASLLRHGIEPTRPALGPSAVVWDRATSGWIIGPDYGTLTTVLLPKLLDWPGIEVPPGAPHPPFIPQREIEYWRHDDQRGKLKNGSLVQCKSNEQSQVKFASAGVDWVHFDEEPPYKNYTEVSLRVEAGRRLRIYGTCTLLPPEGQTGGVTWLYEKIVRPYQQGKRGIGLFGGSIWDNPHILPEEIERLTARYPEGSPEYRIRLGGEWLPGLGGRQCYLKYRADLHVKPQPPAEPRVPLCWFMDFNVNPFCAGVGQYLDGIFRVYHVFELEDGNIDRMVETFRHTYPAHGADVWIYGDATSQGRRVQTARSDYYLIRQGMMDYPTQLKMCVPDVNPHPKDRVNAVNQALQDTTGKVSVEIDPRCEPLILDLEQVVAGADGGPKKITNSRDPYYWRTHSSDGLGYWIDRVRPVKVPRGTAPLSTAYATPAASPHHNRHQPQRVAAGGFGGRR